MEGVALGRSERIVLIKKIEEMRKSRVFCYLTSDRPGLNVQFQKDILPLFVNLLGVNKRYDKIDLFLFTLGGDTLASFGLSRLLREHAPIVNTLIPDKAHSAGTLFALGSNQIIMASGATLSPIDPSIVRPLNPAVQANPGQAAQLLPLSVESVAGFKSLAAEDWKLKGAALATAFQTLTDKVHPLALGDVYRVRQQIEHLASELMRQHRSDASGIKNVVDTLSKKLGSHDYLIYRSEAKKIIGEQIFRDPNIEQLVWDLYLDFSNEMELGKPLDLNLLWQPTPGNAVQRTANLNLKLAAIESGEKGHVAQKVTTYVETSLTTQNGQLVKQVQENVTSAGWSSYS